MALRTVQIHVMRAEAMAANGKIYYNNVSGSPARLDEYPELLEHKRDMTKDDLIRRARQDGTELTYEPVITFEGLETIEYDDEEEDFSV